MPIKRILITGGSGLLGTHLRALLEGEGYEVAVLTRSGSRSDGKSFLWDPQKGEVDTKALEWMDCLIHLAGASVAGKRWDSGYKKLMKDSRIKSLRLIHEQLKEMGNSVDAVISASAIGYYGYDSGSVWKKEDSRFGDDFLATLTKEWEGAADEFSDICDRIVKLRIGIVLSAEGGSLPVMSRPVKMGVGAALGRGDQYVSWIHIDDLSRMFLKSVQDLNMSGIYNAVAPEPVTNKELMKEIARVLKKPFFLPNVPGFVLKLMLGEFSSSVLGSSRVSSEKIINSGFEFNFPKLQGALEDQLG